MSRDSKMKLWGVVALVVVSGIVLSVLYAIGQARDAQAIAEYTSRPRPAATQSTPPPAPPRVLVLGDSYTAGAGAGSQEATWVYQVAADRGWNATNNARGGTSFTLGVKAPTAQKACGADYCPSFAEMAQNSVDVKPDIILISGGRNQANLKESDSAAAITSFFDMIATTFPDAKVYAVTPLWDSRPAPESMTRMAADVRANVERIGGTYLDIGQPLAGHRDLITDDNVHPNAAGQKAIAQAVIAALT